MTQTFDFDASHPAMDLINTVRMRDGTHWDRLAHFEDLRHWLWQSSLLDPVQSEQLRNLPENPAVLAEVKNLRDAFRAVLESLVQGEAVSPDFLQHLNHVLDQHPGHPRLTGTHPPLQIQVWHDLSEAASLTGLLASQMADLLTLDLRGRIKKCENHQCIRHFLDTSKNKTRRWCSMTGCGNRAKAQAFYQRKTGKTPAEN